MSGKLFDGHVNSDPPKCNLNLKRYVNSRKYAIYDSLIIKSHFSVLRLSLRLCPKFKQKILQNNLSSVNNTISQFYYQLNTTEKPFATKI